MKTKTTNQKKIMKQCLLKVSSCQRGEFKKPSNDTPPPQYTWWSSVCWIKFSKEYNLKKWKIKVKTNIKTKDECFNNFLREIFCWNVSYGQWL